MNCRYCGGSAHRPGQHEADCSARDLLARAFLTGRHHARQGFRCAVDTALELFGFRVAMFYERGYFHERGGSTGD